MSEQITEAEPSVSTEERFFTIALRRLMAVTPRERTTERMAGSPSGTAATASETPTISTSTASRTEWMPLVIAIAAITTTAIPMTAVPSVRPRASISRVSGVAFFSVELSSRAMCPISVSMPVAVTTAVPTPCVTAVPLWTMFARSPRLTSPGIGAGPLPTGADSPVSAASAMCREEEAIRRASAATESPSASASTSPGTTSTAGTCTVRPSRTTVAITAAIPCSAATASAARASCT